MNKSTIFVSGPMTGYHNMNTTAFQDAAYNLEARGWRVLSPHVLPRDLSREKSMLMCITMLDQCDAAYFLEGWEYSSGSQAEYYYAGARGIDRYCYPDYPEARIHYDNV